jgi:hypothetical protein
VPRYNLPISRFDFAHPEATQTTTATSRYVPTVLFKLIRVSFARLLRLASQLRLYPGRLLVLLLLELFLHRSLDALDLSNILNCHAIVKKHLM